MKTRYKHIHFEQATVKGGYLCVTNRGNDELGIVRPGAWKRITFIPEPDTEFSDDCLADIIHFIGQVEAERNKPSGASNGDRERTET